jgi:hypothetical protein
MSEVRRWYIGVYGGDAQARTTSSSEFEIIHERSGQYFVLDEDFDRVTAERNALQLRLNAADQRIDELERDKARLDAIESNCWDVRFDSSPNGDAGDSNISIEIVGHWMDKPTERVVGENYDENLRAAVDQAMTAPAYPPARPEYPELDELISKGSLVLPERKPAHTTAPDNDMRARLECKNKGYNEALDDVTRLNTSQ